MQRCLSLDLFEKPVQVQCSSSSQRREEVLRVGGLDWIEKKNGKTRGPCVINFPSFVAELRQQQWTVSEVKCRQRLFSLPQEVPIHKLLPSVAE